MASWTRKGLFRQFKKKEFWREIPLRPYISRGTRNSRLKPHSLFPSPLLFVVSGLDLAGMESVLKVSVLTEEERREAQSIGLSIAPEALILQPLPLPCSLIHGYLNLNRKLISSVLMAEILRVLPVSFLPEGNHR